MSHRWTVELVKSSWRLEAIFGENFFPRKFHYKADAQKLVVAVEQTGYGRAQVVPAKPLKTAKIQPNNPLERCGAD